MSTFRILTIDGGGIRGVFPAHILKRISAELEGNLTDRFGLIAGTSTGSIIAAATAVGLSSEKVIELYRDEGSKIFTPLKTFWPNFLRQGFTSCYDREYLGKVLKDVFQERKLKDVPLPLIIPATDVGNGKVHVFKSRYHRDFVRDPEVPVWQAVLASCSAPTYFDPLKLDAYNLADGGLWANNPALVAFVDAQRRLEIPPSDIKILSIGTGHSKVAYGTAYREKWGLLNGWQGTRFIDFLLSLQAQSTHNTMGLLLGKQLLRLNFESDEALPLDDVSCIGDLISKADDEFTHRAHEIREFFEDQDL
jgi:patatin-like phospholipase/acyl hydrolase